MLPKLSDILFTCFAFSLIMHVEVKAHECSFDEECKNIRECEEFKYVLKREYNKLPKICGFEPNTEKLCCKITNTRIQVATARPAIKPRFINEPRCGSYRIPPKIVGGEVAHQEEFPWMALLQYKSTLGDNDLSFKCGGSLISSKYILTAAHCIDLRSFKLISVRLGEHTISKIIDCDDYEDNDTCGEYPVQDIPVEETIVHPSYQAIDKSNDIALIRLSRAANIVDNVGTICLPVDEEQSVIENLEDINEAKMTIAGWGKTENGSASDVLLYAGVRYLKPEECVARFKEIRARHTFIKIKIESTHLCAGGDEQVDTCRGDSGSPIIYPAKLSDRYRMFQYGVVSAGIDCSISEPFPGIYARTSSYLDWILKNMRD